MGMIPSLIALLVVFGLLLIAEFLRIKEHIRGEVARKFIHITVGSFVAFWPFFLNWTEIRLLCLGFLLVVIADRHLHIFKAVHSVKRRTVGDILFPIGIGLASFLSASPWIFTIAILNLSLGDGLAAIVGNKYGREYNYSLLNQKKSGAGSLAFWLVSLTLMIITLSLLPISLGHAWLGLLIGLPAVTALLESLSIYGLDNVVIPVVVSVILSFFLVVK